MVAWVEQGHCCHLGCTQEAPYQPRDPPEPTQERDYPFQKLYADYFEVRGVQYLVVADRYSSWLSVYRATDLSVGDP